MLVYCAGALARPYEAMGGEVVYYGKPLSADFRHDADTARGRSRAVKRALVIGDGMETDIKGAHRAGLDALFIGGGIHDAEWHAHPAALAKFASPKRGVTARGRHARADVVTCPFLARPIRDSNAPKGLHHDRHVPSLSSRI